MAIYSPVKEDPLEVVRELLIAISQSGPEITVSSQVLCEQCNGFNVANFVPKDQSEELRSELISISCAPSPDNVTLPWMGMQMS